METRRRPRVNINLKIVSKIDKASQQKFLLACGEAFKVTAVDISVLGLGIFSENFLPLGLVVALEIDGTIFDLNESMNIKAEVRYCKYVGESKYRCGMQFMDVDSRYSEAIKVFIDTYERRKEPRMKLEE